jgi:stage IV sporulation protein FB
MFGTPATTDYDLRFQLLGIPVRVTPWFWLVAAILSGATDAQGILIFVACVLISVVIHEFGHGLMAKAFGYRPSIVLQGMFGLCYSEAERQTPWQRLAVIISGPLAGFLTFGVLLGSFRSIGPDRLSPVGREVVGTLLWINLIWSIFNLIPVYPMDGGQFMKVVLMMINPRRGGRWAHIVSLVLAGVIASLIMIYSPQQFWMAIFFAYFALVNYQTLQMEYQYVTYGGDDGDSWRR